MKVGPIPTVCLLVVALVGGFVALRYRGSVGNVVPAGLVARGLVPAADPALSASPLGHAVVSTGPTSPQPPTSAASSSVAPSFDVVRVGPSGSAVLAGRAEPGAQVFIHDGAALLGQSTADSRGEWVLVPNAAIEPGGRSLTLASRTPGGQDVAGAETLVVIVPPRPVTAITATVSEPVMALAVPAEGPARLLQGSAGAGLALQTVDYDDHGAIRFAGVAPPGSSLRLYIDNSPAGTTVVNGTGQWALTPAKPVSQGLHTLRLDQLGTAGVMARIELPFQRDQVPVRVVMADGTTTAVGQPIAGPATVTQIVVQPGQTLWRLARTAYGEGTRYTVIYTANQGQIRDPNLIYPGQAFALPIQ